jgi:hypothetical protein
MSLKKEPSGRRSVTVEVEVPGAPEEVWQAIATGPGVSAWFVPTQIEAKEDGTPVRIVCHFGPSLESIAHFTFWGPPRRFTTESRNPIAPPLTAEWSVEAKAVGTCAVRVVHSLVANTDDWDAPLLSVEASWPGWLRVLRLYLTHFAGQRAASFQTMDPPQPKAEAWKALLGSLGLAGVTAGQRWATGEGAPPLAGVVEEVSEGQRRYQLLRLDEPTPGIVFLAAYPMGAGVCLATSVYLYGHGAETAAARLEPLWQAWMEWRLDKAGDLPCSA